MNIALTYNEPFTGETQSTAAQTAAQVDAFADRLLERYLAAGDPFVPGLELRADNGESLSIAVAPSGWALIRSDANLDQTCTRCKRHSPAGTISVRWEEPTSVPNSWFVPKADAMIGVDRWMNGDGLAAELEWSDDCA